MANLVTPMPMIRARFFDDNSRPLSGGKIYTYEPNTTTPKTTYKDLAATTPNTNPILLDVAGEADIYFDGLYRVIVESWRGEQLYDVDNIGAHTEWDASFVVDATGQNQQKINDGITSLDELRLIDPKKKGCRVYLNSVIADKNLGAGTFVSTTKGSLVDNGGMIVDSANPNLMWVRVEYDVLTPELQVALVMVLLLLPV